MTLKSLRNLQGARENDPDRHPLQLHITHEVDLEIINETQEIISRLNATIDRDLFVKYNPGQDMIVMERCIRIIQTIDTGKMIKDPLAHVGLGHLDNADRYRQRYADYTHQKM